MASTFLAKNLQVVPKKADGSKIMDGGEPATVGRVVSGLLGTFTTQDEINAELAVELSERMYKTEEDQIDISKAEKILLEHVLKGARLIAWVKVHVNSKMIEEVKEDDTSSDE